MFVFSAQAAYFPSSGARVLTGDWDIGGGGLEVENNTAVPGACTVGQIFMDTDQASGDQIYGCEGGAFVQQGDGLGVGVYYNELQAPTVNGSIGFTTFTNLWTSQLDGGAVFTINSTDADLANPTSLVNLTHTVDGGNAYFMAFSDDAGNTIEDECIFRFDGAIACSSFRGLSGGVTDSDTSINSAGSDNTTFNVGGVEYLDMTEAAVDVAVFNDTGVDMDFRFEGDTDADLLFFDGSTDRVGIGNSTPAETLEVDGDIYLDLNNAVTTFGVCHSGADADAAAATDRDLVVCQDGPNDMAEWYETSGAEPGDILTLTEQVFSYPYPAINAMTGEHKGEILEDKTVILQKSGRAYDPSVLGVVSTSPVKSFGRRLIRYAQNPHPVALIGQVPTKVSLENGPIAIGDFIASSSQEGVGMKATQPGRVIGRALQGLREEDLKVGKAWGNVLVFVNPQWYSGEENMEKIRLAAGLLNDIRKNNQELRDEIEKMKKEVSDKR